LKDYVYLGTVLTNKNELRPEVEKRITGKKSILYTSATIKRDNQYSEQKK